MMSGFKKLQQLSSGIDVLSKKEVKVGKKAIQERRKLMELVASMQDAEYNPIDDMEESRLEEALLSFEKAVETGNVDRFAEKRRNLKYLASGLAFPFDDDNRSLLFSDNFKVALEILHRHWRDRYLRGIVRAYAEQYRELSSRWGKHSQLLRDFIGERLSKYEGKHPFLQAVKQNHDFFVISNGPQFFGDELAGKTDEPNSYLQHMGFPRPFLATAFFVETFIHYVTAGGKLSTVTFEDFVDSFQEIGDFEQKRALLSHCIVKGKDTDDAGLLMRLKEVALEEVGDPTVSGTWSVPSNATERERKVVQNAGEVLRTWLNGDLINAFFDGHYVDPDRRNFWRKYLRSIPDVKIAATWATKASLQRDERASDRLLKTRFIELKSGTPLIIFRVGDHYILEFGENGNACYAYRANEDLERKLQKRFLRNGETLKNTSLPKIGKFGTDRRDEGRLYHHVGWQGEFRLWLRNVLGVNPDDRI